MHKIIMSCKLSLLNSLLFLLFTLAQCEPLPGGDNVCVETVTIKKEKLVDVPIKYEIKYATMCGFLPCTKVKTEIRVDSKIVTTFEDVEKPACCSGYAETPDKKCAPICLKSCKNGKCIRPNVCQCSPEPTETRPGFVGSSCDRFVCSLETRWGSKCERECQEPCPATAFCSASTGNCTCRPGWRGLNCSEECRPDSLDCENIDLPPILEPEANAIDSELIISQKLVASQARSISSELSQDEQNQGQSHSLLITHMGLNIFLTLFTFILVFSIFRYKKRLNKIRNELYYGPYSTTSASSSANDNGNEINYSLDERSAKIQNRPRMPLPFEGGDFLGKNLDFAAATRNILTRGNITSVALGPQTIETNENKSLQLPDARNKFLLDSKVETHLMSSQKSAQQNIYSDIDSNLYTDITFNTSRDQSARDPEAQTLRLGASDSISTEEEDHEYQVPRSPAMQFDPKQQP